MEQGDTERSLESLFPLGGPQQAVGASVLCPGHGCCMVESAPKSGAGHPHPSCGCTPKGGHFGIASTLPVTGPELSPAGQGRVHVGAALKSGEVQHKEGWWPRAGDSDVLPSTL